MCLATWIGEEIEVLTSLQACQNRIRKDVTNTVYRYVPSAGPAIGAGGSVGLQQGQCIEIDDGGRDGEQ